MNLDWNVIISSTFFLSVACQLIFLHAYHSLNTYVLIISISSIASLYFEITYCIIESDNSAVAVILVILIAFILYLYKSWLLDIIWQIVMSCKSNIRATNLTFISLSLCLNWFNLTLIERFSQRYLLSIRKDIYYHSFSTFHIFANEIFIHVLSMTRSAIFILLVPCTSWIIFFIHEKCVSFKCIINLFLFSIHDNTFGFSFNFNISAWLYFSRLNCFSCKLTNRDRLY